MIARQAAPGHGHRECTKIAYPSRAKALLHMDAMMRRWHERNGPRRGKQGKTQRQIARRKTEKGQQAGHWTGAYRCPFCHFWHLTSQPLRR